MKANKSAANPRASRLSRLPTSGAVAGKVRWTPSAATWSAIEQAYGVALNDEQRAKVAEIINKYFAAEAFAREAPFAKDGLAWLAGLQSASAEFVDNYNSPRGPQPKKQNNPVKRKNSERIELEAKCAKKDDARARKARPYLEAELDEYVSELCGDVPLRARDLVKIMEKVNAAAKAIAKDIGDKDHARFREKDAWRAMVRKLHKLASDNGLPTAINKNIHPHVSPFVKFVRAVQSTFGDDAQAWHMLSDLSLADKISKAVADTREP